MGRGKWPEITAKVISRNGVAAVCLIVGSYIVEEFKAFFFPSGVPVETGVGLSLGQMFLVLLASRCLARIVSVFAPDLGLIELGPAGLGFLSGLVLLAFVVLSFVVRGSPGRVYVVLLVAGVAFLVRALFVSIVQAMSDPVWAARQRLDASLFMSAVTFFIGVPLFTGILLVLLVVVAWMIDMVFGEGLTARSLADMLLRRT